LHFKFCMHPSSWLYLSAQCTPTWFLLNMLMLKTSYSKALCFNVSKWKFLVCQSTCQFLNINSMGLWGTFVAYFLGEVWITFSLAFLASCSRVCLATFKPWQFFEYRINDGWTSSLGTLNILLEIYIFYVLNPTIFLHFIC
jgi:hypothetical protein